MYIWQIKKLRQQLAIEGLSEQLAFGYYLATAIVGALTYEFVANGPPSGTGATWTDFLDGALYIGFTIVGIIWCFQQNGRARGTDFLKRIVPIGWVMFWRYFALVLLFTLIVGAIQWYTTGSWGRPESESAIEVIIMNALLLWMFWRMGIHMKWVADNTSAAQPGQ